MHECYNFFKVNFNTNNYFDHSLDATYIIHLTGNGRIEHVIEQLESFQPTSNTFILFNEGYKRCKKPSFITKSTSDLVHAYMTVFNHAHTHGFGNVMILEDDFIFADDVADETTCNRINQYINSADNDEEYVYFIGALPIVQIPSLIQPHHNRLLVSLGSQSVIYSKKFIENHAYIEYDPDDIYDWDAYLRRFKRIIYDKCLCYQLFPETENYGNWNDNLASYVIKILIKTCNLDTRTDPGYTMFYVASKAIPVIIIALVLLIIWLIIRNYL
jgi:hypothetical protein